jgi:hypothetical protein
MMVGVPGAVRVLKNNLRGFADNMKRLADNCDPPTGPARKKRPRKKAYKQIALPAGSQGEGENVAADYGDGYDPAPSDESHGAS